MMNNEFIYAFDIGTSSIGWSIRDLNENRIVDLGVRLFDIPEKGKEKKTSCSIRTEQKGTRRLLKRKKKRITKTKELILDHSILTKEELDSLYNYDGFVEDIYKLRVDALDTAINNLQLCRILLFFAKNRGYKSNAKNDVLLEINSTVKADNLESKKVLNSITENTKLLNEKNYRTIGEMLYKDEKFKQKKKNTTNCYISSFSRKSIIEEIRTIIQTQREFGNTLLTQEFEEKYVDLIKNQLPFLLKKDMDKMVGSCSLMEGEKRAPKHSYTFERFLLLSRLNNLCVDNTQINKEDREAIINLAYAQKTIKFSTLRKTLKLDDSARFNLVNYNKYETIKEAENSIFIELNGYHSLKKVFSSKDDMSWDTISLNKDLLNNIAYIISTCKDINEFREFITPLVDEDFIVSLFALDFSKFGNISLKAVDKILPFMEEGLDYTNACINAGLNPNGYSISKEKTCKINPDIYEGLSNSRIIRIVAEFRKVYNNMVSQYGPPKEVNIEVAREVSLSKKKKDLLIKEQRTNEKKNKALLDEFIDIFNRKPTFREKIKYKLWKEQNNLCLYSGKPIPKEYLIDDSKLEVDHAIHISFSGDDSLNNKVLVLKEENQRKGARTPFEYIGDNKDEWAKYIERVNNCQFSIFKKNKLKQETVNLNNGFITRYLNDTREVSIFLYKYMKNNLKGYNNDNIKVRCVNGAVTSFLRSIWNIPKNRENVYHHIEDSLLVGCCDEKFIQRVSKLSKRDRLYKEKHNPSQDIIDDFPLPYKHFITEMRARLSTNPYEETKKMLEEYDIENTYSQECLNSISIVYPSFKLSRKLQGQIHPETVRSKKDFPSKTNYFEVRGGITNSGLFVRIDLFKVKDKYKIVPVYRHNLTKELSNISIGSTKDISKLIVEDKDFIFSLYKNDAVIMQFQDSKPLVALYIATDSCTGAVKFKVFEDGMFTEKRLSLSKLVRFKKIEVDILGKIHNLKYKPREPFNIKNLK